MSETQGTITSLGVEDAEALVDNPNLTPAQRAELKARIAETSIVMAQLAELETRKAEASAQVAAVVEDIAWTALFPDTPQSD